MQRGRRLVWPRRVADRRHGCASRIPPPGRRLSSLCARSSPKAKRSCIPIPALRGMDFPPKMSTLSPCAPAARHRDGPPRPLRRVRRGRRRWTRSRRRKTHPSVCAGCTQGIRADRVRFRPADREQLTAAAMSAGLDEAEARGLVDRFRRFQGDAKAAADAHDTEASLNRYRHPERRPPPWGMRQILGFKGREVEGAGRLMAGSEHNKFGSQCGLLPPAGRIRCRTVPPRRCTRRSLEDRAPQGVLAQHHQCAP